MNRDWNDFKSRCGSIAGAREEFENACEELFRKVFENRHVSQVAVCRGDGGIDIFIGEIGVEPITVIQCKFFLNGIGDSQKSQIRNSFKTAITSEEYELKEWMLCIPMVLNMSESTWWSGWKDKCIKENNKNKNFIKIKNGNELISLMKECDVYNRVFKIEDSLKIDSIQEKVSAIADHLLPRKKASSSAANPNLILFNNYKEISEPYYQERQVDVRFIENLKLGDVWIFGKSGCGKTAVINRNLIQSEIDYLFCDLSPITISKSVDVFEEVAYSIEEKFSVSRSETEKNHVKQICKLIKSCNLKNQMVIVIDELSVNDGQVLREIASTFVKLVTHYNNSPVNGTLRFVVSTISRPIDLVDDKAKASNSFEYVSCEDWGESIGPFFDTLCEALDLGINNEDKEFILSSSKSTPRVLKSILRKIVVSQDRSTETIRRLTNLTLEECF